MLREQIEKSSTNQRVEKNMEKRCIGLPRWSWKGATNNKDET
jgi:hypothetical protein